jgi:hypothetical protein
MANVADFPKVSQASRQLDRRILRNFLHKESHVIVAGRQVIADMGGVLEKTFSTILKYDTDSHDIIDDAFTIAMSNKSDILVLGGQRAYNKFLDANSFGGIEIYRHVLNIQLIENMAADYPRCKYFNTDYTDRPNYRKERVISFSDSFLIKETL